MNRKRRIALGGLVTGLGLFLAGPPQARAGLCAYCGGNAATVGDGIVFDELNLERPLRRDGPTLTDVRSFVSGGPPGGVPVTLKVEGDKLFAFSKDGTQASVPLEGITITLEMRDGRSYEVKLDHRFDDTLRFWAEPQEPVPAYVFKVRKVNQRRSVRDSPQNVASQYADDRRPEGAFDRDLCKGDFAEPTVNERKGQEHAAVVFAGDHYNADHTVTKQEKGSFNLACFGTASAKMHLLRHTTAGIPPRGHATSLDERTAMLRAITADYCGDGRSWTADGTPLWWTDARQVFALTSQPQYPGVNDRPISFQRDIEAVWGPRGKLLCLNEPRRKADIVDEATCSVPAVPRDVVTRGAVACRGGRAIPRCSDFPWENKGRSPWLEAPLQPAVAATDKRLPGAYVVTVRSPNKANYCNKRIASTIAWPR